MPGGMNIEGPRIGPESSLEAGDGAQCSLRGVGLLCAGLASCVWGWRLVCGVGPLCAGLAGSLEGLSPQCVSCLRGWPLVCGVGGLIGGVKSAVCFLCVGLALCVWGWRARGSVRFARAFERHKLD